MVNGSKKNVDNGQIVSSFGLGSKSLYDTIDRNPDFSFRPVESTNLPQHIMQHGNRSVSALPAHIPF